jgi:hypothetical protein
MPTPARARATATRPGGAVPPLAHIQAPTRTGVYTQHAHALSASSRPLTGGAQVKTLQAQLSSQQPRGKPRKGRAATAAVPASDGKENELPAEANTTSAGAAQMCKNARSGTEAGAEAGIEGRGCVLALTGLSSKQKADLAAAADRLNTLLAKGGKAKVGRRPCPKGSPDARTSSVGGSQRCGVGRP